MVTHLTPNSAVMGSRGLSGLVVTHLTPNSAVMGSRGLSGLVVTHLPPTSAVMGSSLRPPPACGKVANRLAEGRHFTVKNP